MLRGKILVAEEEIQVVEGAKRVGDIGGGWCSERVVFLYSLAISTTISSRQYRPQKSLNLTITVASSARISCRSMGIKTDKVKVLRFFAK